MDIGARTDQPDARTTYDINDQKAVAVGGNVNGAPRAGSHGRPATTVNPVRRIARAARTPEKALARSRGFSVWVDVGTSTGEISGRARLALASEPHTAE